MIDWCAQSMQCGMGLYILNVLDHPFIFYESMKLDSSNIGEIVFLIQLEHWWTFFVYENESGDDRGTKNGHFVFHNRYKMIGQKLEVCIETCRITLMLWGLLPRTQAFYHD